MKIEDLDPYRMIDFDEWQEIVDLIHNIAGVKSAAITRVDLPLIEAFKVSKNRDNPFHEGMQVELATHYCEEVINRRGRVHVRDARESERWSAAPEIEHALVSYMGYPILLPDGNIFGTICVHDNKPNAYSEEIDRLIRSFRRVVESHFALAKQAKEIKERMEEIELLKGIIPICSHCKSIRDDEGYWQAVEDHIRKQPDADFSHGVCPACAKKHYPDFDLSSD